MARQFNGTSDFLASTSQVNLSGLGVITLSFWMYWDSFADDDDCCFGFSQDPVNTTGSFFVDPNSSSSAFRIFATSNGILYSIDDFPRPSAATWHQYIIEMDLATINGVNKLWIDNSSQTATPILHNSLTGTFSTQTLHVMTYDGTQLYGAGRMFEFAIYASAISSGDRASLQTDSPSIVGSPAFHWPLCGTASPEPNAIPATPTLTVNGATFVANPSALTGSTCNAGTTTRHALPYLGVG